MSYVYLLVSTSGNTYVGATVNLDRRLRQHNKEIKGGATATSNKVLKGETWKRVCHLKNFPDWSSALQFEWKWKHVTRRKKMSGSPVDRRMAALREILESERSTSKAIPFKDWEIPIELVIENLDE